MDLSHLHLHVRDLEAVRTFYERHFGFSVRLREPGFLILRDRLGFDLAFMEEPNPAPLPSWFHIGAHLESEAAVRAMEGHLRSEGVSIERPYENYGSWGSFRCRDPAGHFVEVYWE